MYGKITKFRPDLGFGVIAADNGRKYRFSKSAILSAGDPLIGHGVDFELDSSRPAHIVMMTGNPWTALAHMGAQR